MYHLPSSLFEYSITCLISFSLASIELATILIIAASCEVFLTGLLLIALWSYFFIRNCYILNHYEKWIVWGVYLMIELILSGISILGMACVSRHEMRFAGFYISLMGNIGWIILGILTANTSFIILFSGYFIFNAIGMHDEYATWRAINRIKKSNML